MTSPTRRAALAVAVALLLVTAGCSGGTTSTTGTTPTTGPATATSTDTDTTTTATSVASAYTVTGDATADQYPPGVAADGTLTNVSAIRRAHESAVANESVALTVEGTNPNGSTAFRHAHAANGTYYSERTSTTDGERRTSEVYRTGSHGYTRAVVGNETYSSVLQNATGTVPAGLTHGMFSPDNAPVELLADGDYTVNGTVERGGRTFVRLTADGVPQHRSHGFVTAYEGTALVTPDGVVAAVHASFERTADNTTEQYEQSVTLDTDADWSGPPPWVADVPRLSLSTVEDKRAFEIRNAGGATLPANTTFRVDAAESRQWVFQADAVGSNATVTTDAPLEPGDAVYVTANADASAFTLHDEPERGAYTFEDVDVRARRGDANTTYHLSWGVPPGRVDW